MINKRQYVMLSFFLTRALFFGGGFSLLVGLGKSNLLLASLVGMIIGLIITYFLSKKKKINRWMCILVSLLVLLINNLANSTLTGTYLLYNTPTLLIMGMFFFVLLYGATKEVKVLGRVSIICIFISLSVFVIAYVGLIPLVKLDNLLPLFNNSLIDFIKSVCVFCGASLLPNVLLINYRDEVKFKHMAFGYSLGCITIIIILFYITAIYGYEFASLTRFPEYLILKKISFTNYVTNLENILVMEWIVNIFISGLIAAKTLKDNTNIYITILLFIILIIGSEILLNRNYVNVLYVKKYVYYVCLCLVLLSLFIKKGKNKN